MYAMAHRQFPTGKAARYRTTGQRSTGWGLNSNNKRAVECRLLEPEMWKLFHHLVLKILMRNIAYKILLNGEVPNKLVEKGVVDFGP